MSINKFGIIYEGTGKSGTVDIKPVMPRIILPEKKTGPSKSGITARQFLLTLFGVSIIFTLWGFMFLFWPVIVQEVRYRLILSHQTTAFNETFPGFPAGDEWSPVNTTFSLVIPKIDAKSIIIRNVDPGDEAVYNEALKKGVAHAKGTCFPGMNCRMYLFAHSTSSPWLVSQFNAVFYLLRKLEVGDKILVYYESKKILYEVTGKEIVAATDVRYLQESGTQEELILQTCDPPGTTLNRFLVFAKPKLVEYLK